MEYDFGGRIKKARPVTYKINGSPENTTLFSRTMFVSGSIIFIFLVLHLGTFFWRFNVHDPQQLADSHQYYDIVVGFFQIWWYVLLYIIAMILLGFHLNHGFQSAFQTFGWNHKKIYSSYQKKSELLMQLLWQLVLLQCRFTFFLFFYGGNQ